MKQLWFMRALYALLLSMVVSCGGSGGNSVQIVSVPTITTQPSNASTLVGQSVSFAVAASGSGTLLYQWRKNGSDIADANLTVYIIPVTALVDSGAVYSVVVSNSAGSISSSNVTLSVSNSPTAPVITTQPTNVTAPEGQIVTLYVAATGTVPLAYQWYKNGSVLSGANGTSYTILAAALADSGAIFSVVVSNDVGIAISTAVMLSVSRVPVIPTITTQPINVSVTEGQIATFSVVATGTGPLSYQWFNAGSVISGAIGTSYTTPITTLANHAALFSVSVSNNIGSTISNSVMLSVSSAPTAPSITSQPTSVSVTVGQAPSFAVGAMGSATLSYQWSKNGGAIAGATNASYTIPATTLSDNASVFSVVVSNIVGNASAAAVLFVSAPTSPTITTHPTSMSVTVGQSAGFTVVAIGAGVLSYQWYKSGELIGGATSASYAFSSTTLLDNGILFAATVSNSVGTTTSNSATLGVSAAATAPSITSHPSSTSVETGLAGVFTVIASGSGTLSYQWTKNGNAISGATSASYTSPVTTVADNGAVYSVVVSNALGSVTSNGATLTLTPSIACIASGTEVDINAALIGVGAEAVLCQGAVFGLSAPVVLTQDGQKIYTKGKPTDGNRAVLRVIESNLSNAIYGVGISNISIENISIDGARPALGSITSGAALIEIGGNAQNQNVQHIHAYEPRGWSTLHIIEGTVIDVMTPTCQFATILFNEIGPAGLPNGHWADGISLACGNSRVENNTITDATDGGIVIFGAPGSIIKNNTITAKTRTLLGGINMVDFAPVYGNYAGTEVSNNTIIAEGAFIKTGIAMGPLIWSCNPPNSIIRGGTVKGNITKGDYFGYSFPVSGVKYWTVLDNVDLAQHVGTPQTGCNSNVPPAPSGFQRSVALFSTLQSEYVIINLSWLIGVLFP